MTFDTSSHLKRMLEAGFTEKQAKIQIEAILELIDEKTVKKQDFNLLWIKAMIIIGIIVVGFLAILGLIFIEM